MKRYSFRTISVCEMCGSDAAQHRILGQRLNTSQGWQPRKKKGISVSVMRCTTCDLIYANPQPIPFDLQDHYGTPPETYWKESYFVLEPDYFSNQNAEALRLLGNRTGLQALDIGAGLGKAMLSMQKQGFEAYGLEPSAPFYERAIGRMGIRPDRLKLGAIEDSDYEAERFDFITFGAVFEHLYEPALCLAKALHWLKPQGIIHLEVPSSAWLLPRFMNFYFRLAGTNYVSNLSPMHPPYHLYEFHFRSFVALASQLGFRIEAHRYDVCDIYFAPKALHGLLRWYMKRSHTGMQFTLYLRKV